MKQKIVSTLRVAIIIASVFALWSNCYKNPHDTIKMIQFIYQYPVSIMKEKDEIKIYNLIDTISIFYFDKYIIYELPATRQFETDTKIKNTEPYFIYSKNNKYGFLFNNIKDSGSGKQYLIDSFLVKRAFKNSGIGIPEDSVFKIIENAKQSDSFFIKKYAAIKNNELTPDSIYYYFSSRFNDISYSLSPKLDSIEKMKLYKLRLLFNETYSESQKIKLPKREIFFEIRKKEVDNPNEIISFIKMAEAQHAELMEK
jgi:hypothetical protein